MVQKSESVSSKIYKRLRGKDGRKGGGVIRGGGILLQRKRMLLFPMETRGGEKSNSQRWEKRIIT